MNNYKYCISLSFFVKIIYDYTYCTRLPACKKTQVRAQSDGEREVTSIARILKYLFLTLDNKFNLNILLGARVPR